MSASESYLSSTRCTDRAGESDARLLDLGPTANPRARVKRTGYALCDPLIARIWGSMSAQAAAKSIRIPADRRIADEQQPVAALQVLDLVGRYPE